MGGPNWEGYVGIDLKLTGYKSMSSPRRAGFAPGHACGSYGGQSGTGAGFSEYFGFPCPSS
jgi:hypothetical protein